MYQKSLQPDLQHLTALANGAIGMPTTRSLRKLVSMQPQHKSRVLDEHAAQLINQVQHDTSASNNHFQLEGIRVENQLGAFQLQSSQQQSLEHAAQPKAESCGTAQVQQGSVSKPCTSGHPLNSDIRSVGPSAVSNRKVQSVTETNNKGSLMQLKSKLRVIIVFMCLALPCRQAEKELIEQQLKAFTVQLESMKTRNIQTTGQLEKTIAVKDHEVAKLQRATA